MVSAAGAESARRSSEASSKARTARVLKLKGRRIRVAGSSLSTSTKTRSRAVSRLPSQHGDVDPPQDLRRGGSPGSAPPRPWTGGSCRARLDGLQGHRQEAHQVGEEQGGQGAAQEQAGGDPEGGAHPGVQALVEPGEGDDDADGDDGAGHRIAQPGQPHRRRARLGSGRAACRSRAAGPAGGRAGRPGGQAPGCCRTRREEGGVDRRCGRWSPPRPGELAGGDQEAEEDAGSGRSRRPPRPTSPVRR